MADMNAGRGTLQNAMNIRRREGQRIGQVVTEWGYYRVCAKEIMTTPLNVYMDVSCVEGVAIGAYVVGEGWPIVLPVENLLSQHPGTPAEISFMVQIIAFFPVGLSVIIHHDQAHLEGMLESKSKRWRVLRKALYDHPLVRLKYTVRGNRSYLYQRCHEAAKKAATEQAVLNWDAKLPKRIKPLDFSLNGFRQRMK